MSNGSPPTHDIFMSVIASIDYILLRATHHTAMSSSVLSRVRLETAVEYDSGQSPATEIEICRCPPGYSGNSCEVSRFTHSFKYIDVNNYGTSDSVTTRGAQMLTHNTHLDFITIQGTIFTPKEKNKYITYLPCAPIGCTRQKVGSSHSL